MPDIDLEGMELDFDLDMTEIIGSVAPPQFDIVGLLVAIGAQVDIPIEPLVEIVVEVILRFLRENQDLFIPPTAIDVEEIMQRFLEFLNSAEVQNYIQNQLNAIDGFEDLEEEILATVQEFLMTAMTGYMMEVMAIISTQIQQAMEQAMAAVAAGIQESIGQGIQQVMTQVVQGLATAIANQIGNAMGGAMDQITGMIQNAIGGVFEEFFDELQGSMEEMMDFDEDVFAQAFQMNMGEEEVFDLMTAIMNPAISTFERNLTLLGYADLDSPTQINIYPLNFEANQAILDILDRYNERMEENDEPERVIHFVDFVGILMASVVDIIDMVGYGLIAFVSISLIVSSIMIGVITFISVLERKKEIGILRAIGASKQNIRTVFNAETLIIGFVAGVLGILLTILIVIVGNIILYNALGIENLAQLPTEAAFILVGISMFLTFIAGLMPASAAARKNPVEALRSE
jgi:cell division protein FtsX